MVRTGRASLVVASLVLALSTITPGIAVAQQQGDWHLGARLIYVDIDARSEPALDTASRVTIGSGASLEFDATYLLTHSLGLEFMITSANHDLGSVAGEYGGLDLGSVWIAESTLSLRYIVPLFGRWRPYIGAGVGAAFLHNSDASDESLGLGIESYESNVGLGFVGQVGLMHRYSESWFFTLDIKWAQLPIDVKLKGSGTTLDTVETDLDPVIIGLGAAYRF